MREPGGEFELVLDREVPSPVRRGAGARARVRRCDSDAMAEEGGVYPDVTYPLVPGHEVAGVIEALGEGVHGGTGRRARRRGWASRQLRLPRAVLRRAIDRLREHGHPRYHGGWGLRGLRRRPRKPLASIRTMLACRGGCAAVCAGITTYNALRQSGVRGGDRVALHGVVSRPSRRAVRGQSWVWKNGGDRPRDRGVARPRASARTITSSSTAGDPAQASLDLGADDLILSTGEL